MNNLASSVDWLARLVAFDTTSRNSNLGLIECVERYLRGLGVPSSRVPSDDGTKANLLAVVGPCVPGGVVLSGHTDVVPIDGQCWNSDPWTLTEKAGRLYGRGTCDMKAFLAVGLALVPEMLQARLRRPIIFALSYDEETGCLGAPSMILRLRDDYPSPSAVIIGEPTSMRVVAGHKGCACYRTTVTGRAAHSSRPDLGVSAVEVAARLIAKITDMKEASRARPDCSFYPPYSSLSANVINGGLQSNVTASECVFYWEVRVVSDETAETFRDEFDAFAELLATDMRVVAPDGEIRTEGLAMIPPLVRRPGNMAAGLAMELTGQDCTETVAYAAEAGQFQQAGFDTVICGPGSIEQAHGPNEFISLHQLEMAAAFVQKLIIRLQST